MKKKLYNNVHFASWWTGRDSLLAPFKLCWQNRITSFKEIKHNYYRPKPNWPPYGYTPTGQPHPYVCKKDAKWRCQAFWSYDWHNGLLFPFWVSDLKLKENFKTRKDIENWLIKNIPKNQWPYNYSYE